MVVCCIRLGLSMSATDLFVLDPSWTPTPRVAVRPGDDDWLSAEVQYTMNLPRTYWVGGSLSSYFVNTTITTMSTVSASGSVSSTSVMTMTTAQDGDLLQPVRTVSGLFFNAGFQNFASLPAWQAASRTDLVRPTYRYIADYYLPQTMQLTTEGGSIKGWSPMGAPSVFGWWDPATALTGDAPMTASTTAIERTYVPQLADDVLDIGNDTGAFPLHFGDGATCHNQPPLPATAALAATRNSFGTYVYDNRGPPQAYYFGTYGTKLGGALGILGNSGCSNHARDGIEGPSQPCVAPVWLSDGFNGYDNGVPRDCAVLVGRLPDCPSSPEAAAAAGTRPCQFSLFYTGADGSGDVVYGQEEIATDASGDILGRSIAYKSMAPCYSYAMSYPDITLMVTDKPFQSAWCVKTDFDEAWQRDCCLGRFASPTLSDGTPATLEADGAGAPVDLGGVFCDPRWHPSDPVGECIPVFANVCSTSVLADGTTVSALADPNHPCGIWYSEVVLGQPLWDPTNEERWTIVDELVQSYCGAHPSAPECACAAFDPYKCSTEGGCFAYTSVTDGSPAAGPCGGGNASGDNNFVPGVRRAQFASADTGAPLSWSDYVCTQPQCAISMGEDGTPTQPHTISVNGASSGGASSGADPIQMLMTSDILLRASACPTSICGQIVADECIAVGSITANTVFIANESELCAGSSGVIEQEAPNPVTEPAVLVVIDLANEQSPFALGGTINVQNTNGTFNFQARVGATSGLDPYGNPYSSWPAWLLVSQTSGAVGVNQSFDIPLDVDLTRAQGPVVPSAFSLQLLLQDTVYPAVTVAVTIFVRVYMGSTPPVPPIDPNPAPQPGADTRVVDRTVGTAWQEPVWRAVLLFSAFAFFVFLVCLVRAWFLHRSASHVRATLPTFDQTRREFVRQNLGAAVATQLS